MHVTLDVENLNQQYFDRLLLYHLSDFSGIIQSAVALPFICFNGNMSHNRNIILLNLQLCHLSSTSQTCPYHCTGHEDVEGLPVHENTSLMHTASLLIIKPEFRELLSAFETNEGRLNFIEGEHQKEMKKIS
jgi:hypothetical protein